MAGHVGPGRQLLRHRRPGAVGLPGCADGNFSLSTSIFDSVDNRCTVREQEMLVSNAEYYYAIQLVLNGEAVANRGDNLAHRGFQPTLSSGSWFFSNTTSMQLGTVLSRWTGANIDVGQNGNDDGRFFVASKVTPIGGGQYHYEYAIHNVDNSRGGATFEVPISALEVLASSWSMERIFRSISSRSGAALPFIPPPPPPSPA